MGIHTRQRKLLADRWHRARSEGRTHDFAWVKDCWRPIKSYRTVKRGRKKGWIEVELYCPEGKKVKVRAAYMRYKEIDYAGTASAV